MPPAFPFPQPQAPAKAETMPLYHCSGCGKEKRRNYCLRCGTFGNTATNEIVPEPRAFGWCGCTEALPCHEHERRTK